MSAAPVTTPKSVSSIAPGTPTSAKAERTTSPTRAQRTIVRPDMLCVGAIVSAGVRLADTIAPTQSMSGRTIVRWALVGLVVLSAFALVGVPGAMLLTDFGVVTGAALIAAYLVHEGLSGAQAARVAAPSAVVFALVTTVAAV